MTNTFKLTNPKLITQNIKVLQELESIITKELGENTNPAKIGMYMKLLWEREK